MSEAVGVLLERKIPFALIALILTLGGYAVGIGYNMAIIGENTRRVQTLESRADAAMTKDDAADFKRRLERIEDKMDRMSRRQDARDRDATP